MSNKYIDAEKLKAEIKRLEEMDYSCDTLEQSAGFYDALDRIKSFIASLVEEEPTEGIKGNLEGIPSNVDLEDNVTWCKDRIYKKDIAYIRKDALLEWANNMKRICKAAEPIEKAYQTMIEKIESL